MRIIDWSSDVCSSDLLLAGLAQVRADLGEQQHAFAHARARAQPAADDGLGLAAAVARHPGGVRIGGIDGIEAVFDEGVEDVEAGGLVQGPAEDVAAQDQRGDLKAGAAKRRSEEHTSELQSLMRISYAVFCLKKKKKKNK